MRGGLVQLELFAMDQENHTLFDEIEAEFKDRAAVEMDVGEKKQTLQNTCNKLSFHVFTVKASTANNCMSTILGNS